MAKALVLKEGEIDVRSVVPINRQSLRDKFNSMLNDRNVRRTLLQSVRSFFEKPGIFAKSLWILLLPRLYYKNYYLRFNKR